MTEKQLTTLIRKYLSGAATEEEKKQVEHWYESLDASFSEFMDGDAGEIKKSSIRSLEAIRKKISHQSEEMHVLRKAKTAYLLRIAAAAAVVMILISGGMYFLSHKAETRQSGSIVQHLNQDIQPGGNNAILTLSNGTKIILDTVNNGLLSMQGSTKIIKLNSGQLRYTGDNKRVQGDDAKVLYNTITTPRGGQYQVVLPDGSRVWLNAASSIRFPTVFSGKNREVHISGEAYFEVEKNANMPFKVLVNDMTIEVLGTHFNVMAYEDEPAVNTTLLEGSVKVTKGNANLLLKPGQEARMNQKGKIQLIEDVNVNEAVAWKNNLFWLDGDDIQSVMRSFSRWYDVDIMIRGNIPDRFTGSIPRNLPFSKVFEVLQKTGSIHFDIENGKIIVTP